MLYGFTLQGDAINKPMDDTVIWPQANNLEVIVLRCNS